MKTRRERIDAVVRRPTYRLALRHLADFVTSTQYDGACGLVADLFGLPPKQVDKDVREYFKGHLQ